MSKAVTTKNSESRCFQCGSTLLIRENQEWHYVECGLNDVYLIGVTIAECPLCKTSAPRIPSVKELHLLIALQIVRRTSRLSGKKIRFLRKELRMKSKDLAERLDYSASEFSRLENGKNPIGKQGDRLLRLYFLTEQAKTLGYNTLEELVRDALSRLDEDEPSPPICINIDDLIIHRSQVIESSAIQ